MRKSNTDFRFYDVPQGESVLALLGKDWDRVYGHDESGLHFHNLMEIGICRRGAGYLTLGDRRVSYRTGSITVIPENCPHTTVSDGEDTNFWEYIYLDCRKVLGELFGESPLLINSLMEAMNREPLLLKEVDEEELYPLLDSIVRELKCKKEYYKIAVDCYVKSLVLEIARKYSNKISAHIQDMPKTQSIRMQPAITYIAEHYKENIKIGDVSDILGVSETHFRRMFEDSFSMSPKDYINLIRIQKACELMKTTDLSMEEVSLEVGFISPSTYTRNFKKYLNISPYQWKINPQKYEGKLLDYNISALKGWN